MKKALIILLLGGSVAVAACGPADTDNDGVDTSPDVNAPSDMLESPSDGLESPSDMLESPSAS